MVLMIMIIVLMSTFFNVIFPNCLLLESRGHSPTNTQMGRRRRSQKDESLIDVGGKMYSNESLLFRYVHAALVLSLSLQYVFVTCPTLQCFFHKIVLVASNIKTQGISEAFKKQDIWQVRYPCPPGRRGDIRDVQRGTKCRHSPSSAKSKTFSGQCCGRRRTSTKKKK